MSELTASHFESSDDELPEEVTFKDSKSAALQSVKDALESVKREKIQQKEKRRKRQQLFLEQKKRKCLSDDLLEELESLPKEQTELPENKVEEKNTLAEKTSSKTSKTLQNNYSVVKLNDNSTGSVLQQSAMSFVHSRLYGPGTKRTTNAELFSLSRKKGQSQGPSIEFANKNLDSEQKEKVQKCNKRFARKNRMVS